MISVKCNRMVVVELLYIDEVVMYSYKCQSRRPPIYVWTKFYHEKGLILPILPSASL